MLTFVSKSASAWGGCALPEIAVATRASPLCNSSSASRGRIDSFRSHNSRFSTRSVFVHPQRSSNSNRRFFSSSRIFQSSAPSSKNEARSGEVVQPGMYSIVQDYPGRDGFWRVGVPPSGPMDDFAFRIANRLVDNKSDAAALEITYTGPTIRFGCDTVIALTGAKMIASIDEKEVPYWRSVRVKAGSTLTLQHIEGSGSRTYLAVAGGINAPDYLGSKATFPLGNVGGPFEGRPLKAGDLLTFGVPASDINKINNALPAELIPKYSNEWEIGAVVGPQAAPDYFTKEDIETFFTYPWEVSHNASRLGVRLIGPRPKFTRPDGGEGGSHPSNLHDNAYAIGSVNFTGDHPVVLTVDGPSLGGFVCPATIPTAEFWKIGQVKPTDIVKFKKLTLDQALQARSDVENIVLNLNKSKTRTTATKKTSYGESAVLRVTDAGKISPAVQYRVAGDEFMLVEYGDLILDINLRVRVHLLEEWLVKRKLEGLVDTIPGVRSLLIQYNPLVLSIDKLMDNLIAAEKELPDASTVKVRSRIFNLPLAFRDKWSLAAIDKYSKTVRSEAPYLPDNVEFVARNNGLKGIEDVRKLVFDTSYMVLGLGDVYLGAPCATPLDPRQRLVVPKYNPARTFTPEGAVGIGGAYMCIYPMESPGGYQLIGRSLPIWNTHGNLPNFAKNKPWLLDMFDQVRFVQVSEDELEKQRAAFSKGDFKLDVKEEVFDVAKYNQFVKSIQPEVDALKERQKKAQAVELKRDAEMLGRARRAEESANKVVTYLASMVVNGPDHPGAVGEAPSKNDPVIPTPSPAARVGTAHSSAAPPRGLKQVFDEQGPEGFAKAVRARKGLLLTDTTWRDAHQSLLATRVRTIDLANIAQATSHVLANCYSLECWGGATFDVALRFLHECPWDRLAHLRSLVPNIPFQMLLRGANAVGYTSYPDNVVYKFCKKAKTHGMDVFRVFDSLNYMDNLKLGIDAVGEAGGIIEAVICYSGDIANPKKTKYTLDYYLTMARDLVKQGIHVLCVKDMAGLLKPRSARILISALRREFPNVPIHVHTHDTAGTGVASMLACFESGADAVDVAIDAMSGLTSQPAMGAIVNELAGTEHDTGIDLGEMQHLTTYWEGARRLYAPFESGQKSAGSDVYLNEIPGGQYTNMLFQALSLGLASEWDRIKVAYAEANRVLGDIIKVTPSSKVVGDLAQFMVTNNLNEKTVVEQAEKLNFPSSVVECLQGYLGHPFGGFPEPFRSRVLKNLPRVEGRPGASMKPYDFEKVQKDLEKTYSTSGIPIREEDVLSYAQYPKVFQEYASHLSSYGSVTNLPTRHFIAPLQIGEQTTFSEGSKAYTVKLVALKDADKEGNVPVHFEVNGKSQVVSVKSKPGATPFIMRGAQPKQAASTVVAKEKADKSKAGHVGAPMPGKVVEIKAQRGSEVDKGVPLVVLSSMKMETIVSAPIKGKVTKILIKPEENVTAGDLLFEISP